LKKVLVDLGKLKDLNSGLGQVSLNFGHELSNATRSTTLSLHFLVPRNFVDEFEEANIHYVKLSLIKRWFPALNSKYDVWHAIHQDSGFMPPAGIPYLLTIHDLNFMYEKSQKKAAKRLSAMQKKINRAEHITFISRFAKEEALKFVDLKGKPTSVIYNGVKTPDKKNMTQPSWIPSGDFLFSIGVVRPKKNFLVLVEMMSRPELQDYSLVIAGNDDHAYAGEIMEAIAEYGLEDKIVLTGSISETEKNYFYHHCSGLLIPSLYEGFGLPVIEAMLCGKPVFSSRSTSLPEIGGDKAFYWDSFDPSHMAEVFTKGMETFNKNPHAFEKELKEYAARFSWKENTAAYIALYESMAHARKSLA
jgi:glycosyltransferase involved in cell wall biosynthesis